MAGHWMRARIEYCIKLIIGISIGLIVFSLKVRTIMTTENAGDIGIMITYLIIVSASATGLLFASSNLAKSASSIERLHEYAYWDEHEESFDKPAPKNKSWPQSGRIEAKNLSVRYRKGLPLVISDLSFVIESGQKVGIVGRTGSGKSTLLLALMRVLEMAEENEKPVGEVTIDGQKIDAIGLHHVRNSLAIIPQDPFLLEGSLKFNIDPFNKFTEVQILSVIKKVGVAETIKAADLIDQRVEVLKKEKMAKMMLMGKKKGKGKPKVADKKEAKSVEKKEKDPLELDDLALEVNGPVVVVEKKKGAVAPGGEFSNDEAIKRITS